MKTLYLDCGMGAAGDMLTGALVALLGEEEQRGFLEKMNGMAPPGVQMTLKQVSACGIVATRYEVLVDGEEESSIDVADDSAEGTADTHACGQGHAHTHEHGEEHSRGHEHTHRHGEEHGHGHTHGHGEEYTHGHGHTHGHGEEHTHGHDHTYGHDHAHGDGGHHKPHRHTTMGEMESMAAHLDAPDAVKENVVAVYRLLADAESKAHGVPVTQIHFHEVGHMDAISDIVGTCILMNMLAPEQVVVSPVHVGCGKVRCAHGILPVPAPATMHLLKGVPVYGGAVRGELCTPTGAALLVHFADRFGDMPVMCVEGDGYGMGRKTFGDRLNCVRALIGDARG